MPRPNKRQFVRHPSSVPVEICDHGIPANQRRVLRNISQSGLCYHAASEYGAGHSVSIRFPSLESSRKVQGIVVWCRPSDDGYDVGIEFLDAEDVHAVRMYEQIFQIERYRFRMQREEGRLMSIEGAAAEWIAENGADFPL